MNIHDDVTTEFSTFGNLHNYPHVFFIFHVEFIESGLYNFNAFGASLAIQSTFHSYSKFYQ